MKATITDVAKRAGVSMKTVSRVLNNEPNVAVKTRERVMEVASELRYSPNLAARGLATSKSYLLALMYDNPSPNYIARVQRGAIDACRSAGYHLVVEPLRISDVESREEKKKIIQSVLDRLPVDGVILTPPLCDSKAILDTLTSMEIPFVKVAPDNTDAEGLSVGMDDTAAAREMVEHIIAQGHQRIGFIKGHTDHGATRLRLNGYRAALLAAGIAYTDSLVASGDFSFESGVKAAEILLSQAPEARPTVIFASNDDMAAAVMHVAGRMNIDVPSQLSVCGFDDTPLAKVLFPPLTTVQQPIYDMGHRAAEMLIKPTSETEGILEPVLEFEIKLRESVVGPASLTPMN